MIKSKDIIDVKKTNFVRYQFELFDKHFSFLAGYQPRTSQKDIIKMALIDSGFTYFFVDVKNGRSTFKFVGDGEKEILTKTILSDNKISKITAKLSAYPRIENLNNAVSVLILLRKHQLLEERKTCKYKGCPSPYKMKPPCALCYE